MTAAARAAMAVVLLFVFAPRAEAQGFATRPQSSLRRDLAAALGVPVEQIVGDVSAVDFRHAGGAEGAVLGRYREKPDGRWTFPGLGIYHACPQGTCVARVHLGAASSQLFAVQLVDLDAPRTQVAVRTSFGAVAPRLVQPDERVRFPALLVVTVRSGHDGDGGRGEREVDLSIISLREPSRPRQLTQLTLERSSPEPTDLPRGAPGPRTRGTRIEGITFAREGDERTLVVVDRLMDTHFNRCLRPEPGEHRYLLEGGQHYRQVSSTPSAGCN